MSLPGLGLSQPEEEIRPAIATQHAIPEGSEWRFEVASGKYLKVQLLGGTAEVFGTEIVSGQTYTFTCTKASIFTWHGCTIEVSGDACQSEYIAEETPMTEYANVHFALETLRNEAKQQGRGGPRVLVVGPDDAGKTSLTKILTGYAVRIGRQPMVVNLDTKEGMLSIPSTMTAAAFKTMIDIEEGWGSSPMSGPSAIPVKLPLAYSYGLPDPNDKDGEIYRAIISRLALAVSGRLESDPESKEAGIIIDTSGSISQARSSSSAPGSTPYATISHIVSEFSISAIVVLGSERLYVDLQKRFDGRPTSNSTATLETVSVVKLSKSGGCVDRDEDFMRSFRSSQIRDYFYGNSKLTNGINLSPHQQTVDFSFLAIYKFNAASPSSTVPDDLFAPGGSYDPDPDTEQDASFLTSNNLQSFDTKKPSTANLYTQLTNPSAAMSNCILTVLNVSPHSSPTDEDIRDASVMGFLYVADVDEAKRRITVLSPMAGRIPDGIIVWSTSWPEEVLGLI
ncbi:putative mrna cleavage factor complex ii protein [Phaeomoniella chlamydospora]|uniref:Polynucleotide 5'-hydroxyl-kinase GRC3 n=1 Tax=Phaeomoniella chlamydospora TaxID=158046 RepID=A0A0G2GPB4_PHACM|nr:putative mrna cleavage factor complex ii protein [Phaeomoniella chlamydospora]